MTTKVISILLIILLQIGCSSVNEQENEEQHIQLSIGGSDTSYTLIIKDNSFIQGAIYYEPESFSSYLHGADKLGYTSIGLFNSSGSVPFHISILFAGNQTGTFYWNNDSLESSLFVQISEEPFSNPFYYVSGFTKVLNFAKVGDKINGLVSGLIIEQSSGDTLSISGDFSLIRRPDASKLP